MKIKSDKKTEVEFSAKEVIRILAGHLEETGDFFFDENSLSSTKLSVSGTSGSRISVTLSFAEKTEEEI